MKYIAFYGLLGVALMIPVVFLIPLLQLSTQLTSSVVLIFGIVLFTTLGALLRRKLKLSIPDQSNESRN